MGQSSAAQLCLCFSATAAPQARFPSAPPVTFRQLAPDATLRLRVYDGEPEGALCFGRRQLYPKKLLGQADLHVANLQVRGQHLHGSVVKAQHGRGNVDATAC